MSSFVTHLEAAIDGTRLDHRRLQTLHADRPLVVRYDLDAIRSTVDRARVEAREPTMWRYRELLPVEEKENIVSLGEGMSPLIRAPRLARELGLEELLIKDESQLPTGSFKSRGLSMAVSRAKELGVERLAIPTAGNAGGALAAYAARAGLEAFVFLPADAPCVSVGEAQLLGAHVYRIDGLITDCAAIVAAGKEVMKWFDLSTLKEPYRIEGKKTMGLELAEQLGWRLPDAIFYPTGGGTGLIGMWKAFAELEALGWLEDTKRPRMYACQSATCDPIVRAFDAGERHAEEVQDAQTLASGIRVPRAIGDFMILDAVRESGGAACRAGEEELIHWMERGCALEGISLCPEAGACLSSIAELLRAGKLSADATTVVFNTGAVQKYIELLPPPPPEIKDAAAIDWKQLSAQASRNHSFSSSR